MKRNLLKIVTLCAAVALCLSAVLCFGLTASAATTTLFDGDVSANITIPTGRGVYVNVADVDAAMQADYAANGAGVYSFEITATGSVEATAYPCVINAEEADIWPARGGNFTATTAGSVLTGDLTFDDVAPLKLWIYSDEGLTLTISHIKLTVTREGTPDVSDTSEDVSETSEDVSETSEDVSDVSDVDVSDASDVDVSDVSDVDVSDISDVDVSDASDVSETSEPTEIKHGDADGDGDITMKDVLAIRKFIANMEVEINEATADAYRDGAIDMKDVLVIRKFIANMIEELPVYPEEEVSEVSEVSEEASEEASDVSEVSEEASEEASDVSEVSDPV